MKRALRILSLVLLLAMVLSLAMPAALAEGGDDQSAATCPYNPFTGEHVYIIPVCDKEATCTEEAQWHKQCSCGAKGSTYTTDALGHAWTKLVTEQEPTCVDVGRYHWECARCEAKKDSYETTVNDLNHAGDVVAKNLLDNNWYDHSHTMVCKACGAPTGKIERHNWVGTEAKEATCTEAGYSEGKYCSICGYDKRTHYAATGHNWGDWEVTTAATCTTAGVETRTCSKCKATETRETELDPTNHTGSVTYVDNKDGLTHDKVCAGCQAVLESGIAHTWDEGTVTTAATCTVDGVKTYTCTACAATKTETIAATGHNWGDWEVTTAATCTTAGEETRTCSKCKATETRETKLNPTNHTGDVTYVDNKDGLTHDKVCAGCQAVLESDIAHTWDKGIVTTPATCTADGVKTHTCTACAATKTETIAATDHSWDEGTVTKEPTCTEPGYEGAKQCTVCKLVEGGKKTKPLGHLFRDNENGGPWTDSGDGKTHYAVCSRCYHKESHLHWMGPWEVGRYATETQDGYMIRWCVAPGCTYHETMVLKAGSSPKTGDDSQLMLWSLTALVALGGAALTGVYATRRKKD